MVYGLWTAQAEAANRYWVGAGGSATADLSSGLVAYWKFDETSGTSAADSSGNSRTATLSNSPSWVAGKVGNALSLDGTTQYGTVSHAASLSITGTYTISAWVKKTSNAGYDTILTKGTTSTVVNYWFGTNEAELANVFYTAGWQEQPTSGANLQTGTWYHVAATYNDAANTVVVYVNGTPTTTLSTSASLTTNGESLQIGRSPDGEYFAGTIDEVRLYNRVLSSTEISALWQGETGTVSVSREPWNGPENWSATSGGAGGVSVPGSGDVALFNGSGLGNCSLNTTVNVAGINIASTYTGTVTQAAGNNVTLGSSGYTQAGGTFNAGNATITAQGNWTYSGGTFTPGASTVIFGNTATSAKTITGSHTLNHVKFDSTWGDAVTVTIASGTTLTVAGTLTMDNTNVGATTINTGTLAAQGNIVVADANDYRGSATILINGTGDQTFTSSATRTSGGLPNVRINKTAGTLTLSGTIRATENWTYTAGTLVTTGSTVVFEGTQTITGSHTLNHVTFDINGIGAETITIASGTTLTVAGTLTLDNTSTGAMNIDTGTLAAQGDVTTDATIFGTAAFTLTGGNNQSLNIVNPTCGNITINKSGGVATLARNLSVTQVIGQDLTITAGTLDLNGFTLTVDDVLTNNGTIIASGAGTRITAGTLTSGSAALLVRYTGVAADTGVTVRTGTYGKLEVDNSGTTFTLGGAVTTLGDVSITAGSILDVSTSNYGLTVAGNWANAGTFTRRSGTVTLNGANPTLTGATTFYKLSKTTGGAHTLTFPSGVTTTVQNSLSLSGSSANNPLYLRSSVAGSPALLTLQSGGTQSLLYLDVKDSNASGGVQLTAYDSVNSGNNTNWSFQALSTALANGLLAHWTFDEGSGSAAADASGNGRNGTVTNATWTTGKYGGALSFNGTSARVVGPSISLGLAFTWSAWINNPVNGAEAIMSVGDYRESLIYLDHVFFWDGGSGFTFHDDVNDTPPNNVWYHRVITYDGTNLRAYLNGSPFSTPLAASLGAVSGVLVVGAVPEGASYADFFSGKIDDARFYNRALSASEVLLLNSVTSSGTGLLTLKDPVTLSATLTNATSVTTVFSTLEAGALNQNVIFSNTSGSFTGSGITMTSAPAFTPAPGTTWPLSAGDGEKVVYARISLGGSTYDVSDTITLDATPPAAPSGLVLTANADNTGITATVTAPSSSDVASLIWRYTVLAGNVAPSYPATSDAGTAFGAGTSSGVTASSSQSITASSLTQLQTYGVRVWAKDTAGNVSATYAQNSLYLAPPTPRLVISAPSNATAAAAGTALTLTLTAKDENGNVITTYAGPYSLTWTPTGGSATTLVSSSSTGWSSGVATTSVTIGGASAGPGSFNATDNSDNALTNGTLSFTFYPSAFTVTPSATSLIASEPFTLTVSAKDSAGATVTRYSGTANMSLVYSNPPSGARGLPSTLISPASFAGGIATVTLHYPDAGQVQIVARDTGYVSGITVQGTSATLTFKPKAFIVIPMPLPAFLTKPYVNQPFDVLVRAMAADGVTITDNYIGTVTLTGEGFTLGTATRAFVPLVDRGSALITGVKATSAGNGKLKATDGSVIGQSAAFGVRDATLVLNSASGPPGALTVTAYIKDTATGLPVSEDRSTRVSVTINDQSAGTPATSPATGSPLTVFGGTTSFQVTKPEEGTATVSAVVQGFSMPVHPATVIWSKSATTSSTTTFQVIQFEQAPSTSSFYYPSTTTYTAPSTSTTGTGFYFPATSYQSPSGTSSTTSTTFTTPATSSSTFTAFSPAATSGTTFAPPPGMGSFTMGGTRYDAAVSMGHTLVAPQPGSAMGFMMGATGTSASGPITFGPQGGGTFSGPMPSGYGPSTGGAMPGFGPPAAMRSKMEGLAQSWKDSGKIDAGQLGVIMEGIQTGRPPQGAEGMFSPEMGSAMHQEFGAMAGQQMMEMGNMPMMDMGMDMGMMGMPGMGGEMGMPDGMPPSWLMGPGMEGANEGVMVFDPAGGGWTREGADMSGFEGEGGEGEEEDAAFDATTEEAADTSPTTTSSEPTAIDTSFTDATTTTDTTASTSSTDSTTPTTSN